MSRLISILLCAAGLFLGSALAGAPAAPAGAPAATLAFLGVQFINDNASFEPTTGDERRRISDIGQQLVEALSRSGGYAVKTISSNVRDQSTSGQPIGQCGGCEASLAKSVGAQTAAWVTVQKVSNLILNINVYMEDAATGRVTFTKSVDLRGNTDESWHRGMAYLIDNYLLPKS